MICTLYGTRFHVFPPTMPRNSNDTLDDHFASIGNDYHDFHRILSEYGSDIIFRLTSIRQEDINTIFASVNPITQPPVKTSSSPQSAASVS